MDSKEAIELVKINNLNISTDGLLNTPHEVKYIKGQVIALLQQGEAYRQMWSGIEYGNYLLAEFDNDGYLKENHSPSEFRQKYLKEANPNEAGKAKDNRK